MNALMNKVTKVLTKTFHVTEFLDNALAVSFSEGDLPFALVIQEDESPDTIYFSPAVDAPDPYSIADITLRLVHIAKTELAEPFYLDQEGELFWGAEAYETYMSGRPDLDSNQAFLDLESPSKLVN